MVWLRLIWIPTLIIYGLWLVVGIDKYSCLIATVLIVGYWLREICKLVKKIKFNLTNIVTWLIMILFLVANLFVLRPFLTSIRVNGSEFVSYSGVTDFFKNSFVVTSILKNGLKLKHPFFPMADFKYYYGWYLIPALISNFLRNYQLYVIVFFSLISSFLACLAIKDLVWKYVKSSFLRVSVFFATIVGFNFELIPALVDKKLFVVEIYGNWVLDHGINLRVNNNLSNFLWTPQHFLAAVMTIYLIEGLVLRKKMKNLDIFGIIFFVILSSAFVGMYMMMTLGLVFLFFKENRVKVFGVGTSAILVLAPYIIRTMSGGTGLFELYEFNSFEFIKGSTVVNGVLTYVCMIGVIPLICLYLLPKLVARKYSVFGTLILGWILGLITFVRSKGWNDFGMRSVLPVLIASPIIYGWIVEKIKVVWKRYVLIGLFVVSVAVSIPVSMKEYLVAWKKRGMMSAEESQLIKYVRGLPKDTKLLAFGRDEWIYKIPSLGFLPVMTNDLYDAGVYVGKNDDFWGYFQVRAREIFIELVSGKYGEVDLSQKSISRLRELLEKVSFDLLIVDKKVFVKKGVNPWFEIFQQADLEPEMVSERFAIYQKSDLVSFLDGKEIRVGERVELPTKDHKIDLKKGLWFLNICNKSDRIEFFKFEPEDHFAIFEAHLAPSECKGNYFFQTDDILVMSNQSNVENLVVYPVWVE